ENYIYEEDDQMPEVNHRITENEKPSSAKSISEEEKPTLEEEFIPEEPIHYLPNIPEDNKYHKFEY
ncbi:10456_t:CDS:1, partial [Gigaspora rosea]